MPLDFDPNSASLPDSGAFGLPHTAEQAHVILVPVPFEATTSYGGGTSDGPEAILEASRQVDLFDLETGRPYERGIHMLESPADVRAWSDAAKLEAAKVIEAGGVDAADPTLVAAAEAVNRACEQMNAWVHSTARTWLDNGRLVAGVGGDHGTSFGMIQAHAERFPGMGVLHVDAHADLRDAYEGFTWSHASIMHNVATRLPGVEKIVQVGIRDFCEEEFDFIEASKGRIRTFFDAHNKSRLFNGEPWGKLVDEMVSALPRDVFISFDIDGLDPVLCPSTGTPVPGGLSFAEANALIAAVAKSGRRIVGFDLNEVSPAGNGDEWDGNVGARMLYKLIGWTLKSQQG